jgi:tight adherence protein B
MSPLLISIAVFVGVTALVGSVALMMRGTAENVVEDRLDLLTGTRTVKAAQPGLIKGGLLVFRRETGQSILEMVFSRFANLTLLIEQSGSSLDASRFGMLSAGLATVGAFIPAVLQMHALLVPAFAALFGALPLFWLQMQRKRRFKKFAKQLPDALELISRALRAGHSLAAGFSLAADEMTDPIGTEFGRVFEEQNLGIPMEQALETLTVRMPSLDVRFFATAVVLQRQTGGDLAEILDKIGYLVRERFKIYGQVQALTGEGRLSGIILLALPPLLFLAVYRLNPEYIWPLFVDPMGKKMLAGGAVMQVLGALVIRKIVNIRV